MPAPELRLSNQTAYFRKAISSPSFGSESVLTRDPFQFADLWLRRNCKEALPYWKQAESYFEASRRLPPVSSPLTNYYCFLNAAKALLLVKGVKFADRHGVAGAHDPAARRILAKEVVQIQGAGIMAALSSYLQEQEIEQKHTLTDLLANLPFIHRAYRHTFRSKPELFLPIQFLVYRKHPQLDEIWFSAEIKGRYANKASLATLPNGLEVDAGYTDRCVIRSKKRIKWAGRGAKAPDRSAALDRLAGLHRRLRLKVGYISAPFDLWYVKRSVGNSKSIDRYGMTIIMAIMHRLSELSRYDPKGLIGYLEGQAAWLLSEFIALSPAQFIDELVCEMTSLEVRIPGVRF